MRLNLRVPCNKTFPDAAIYEATPQDVTFLRRDLNGLDTSEGIRQFETLIKHFELTEHKDFDKYFKNTKTTSLSSKPTTLKPKLPNIDLYSDQVSLFPQSLQDQVINYWRQRQKLLRRPLLRKHWRILHLNNHGYGEQDNNKLAFANRANNKMNLRKSNRMLNGMPLVEKLKELLKENEQAMFIVKMVRQREILKLDQLMLGFDQKDILKHTKRINENLEKSRAIVDVIKDKVLNDEPLTEPNREEKEDNQQDCLIFFANIVHELNELDLQLDDFNSRSLDAIKDKFFELKKKAGVNNSGHRSYSRGAHSKGKHFVIILYFLLGFLIFDYSSFYVLDDVKI